MLLVAATSYPGWISFLKYVHVLLIELNFYSSLVKRNTFRQVEMKIIYSKYMHGKWVLDYYILPGKPFILMSLTDCGWLILFLKKNFGGISDLGDLREILEILDVKEKMKKWVVVWSLKGHAS